MDRRQFIKRSALAGGALWATPTIITVGAAAMAGSPPPACMGGVFHVPANHSVTLNLFLSGVAANDNTLGYQLNGGANVPLLNKPCGGGNTSSTATIGPFATPTTLRVYMEDKGNAACGGGPPSPCDMFFYSDNAGHTVLTGSGNGCRVQFSDSFFCTCDPSCARNPKDDNGDVTVTIN
jgi:hypothetical protein